ncbi:MAG: quaternary ammonium compound efflux SMR transporter SugE [Rubricoccaceae bacterium]
MAWLLLIVSGLLETVWAVGLRYTEGFTRLGPSAFVIGAIAISIYGFSLSVRVLPVGTAYAVWTGIGTLGAAVFGIVVLGEPRTAARLVCIGLIVAGIVGLKLFGGAPDGAPPAL